METDYERYTTTFALRPRERSGVVVCRWCLLVPTDVQNEDEGDVVELAMSQIYSVWIGARPQSRMERRLLRSGRTMEHESIVLICMLVGTSCLAG